MSRSRRYTPITGHTLAKSEKRDKVMAHREARRTTNQLMGWIVLDDVEPPHPKEYGNPWDAAKDGRGWFDPIKHPKLMRK